MLSIFLNAEGRLRSGWKVALFLLAIQAGEILVSTAFAIVPGGLDLLMGPFGEGLLALVILAVTWQALRAEGRALASVGLRLDRRWLREIAIGLGLGAALIALSALLLRALGGFVWIANPGLRWAPLATGLVFYLLVALAEELEYRGYPFQRLVEGLGPLGGQLLFALYFGWIHWGNDGIRSAGPALKAVTTLNIALAAILLGMAYLRTRSLALPIGIHWAWNFTQGHLLGFPVSGTGLPVAPLKPVLAARPDWLTGGDVGLEGSLCCTVVCLAFIGLLFTWRGSAPKEA